MSTIKNKLPIVNEAGLYEIRVESIGGLGANLAGKLLAEAGVLGMGLNGVNFASYGSEKKGTPVKAFVKFSEPDLEIRSNGPVEEPHLLVVFHERLITSTPLTQGVKESTTVIVNTGKSPDTMREMLKLYGGTVACIDALKISIEERVKINTPMLGAIVKASNFIDKDALKGAITDTFKKKYPNIIDANLKAFERGYNELTMKTFKPDGLYEYVPFRKEVSLLGYKNAPIGGVILNPGNSINKDLSASRTGYMPLFIQEKCTNCGECEITCPDYCFVWEKGVDKHGRQKQILLGIDYQFCKGCMKCVQICKFDALHKELESEYNVEKLTIKHTEFVLK
ncbi:MAG: 2-oxoacid:acceptor oxidoreductase family protein [Deltaproteobacteria bacterium]|nr:2-oxoacid:acceptor oxidoreductase family protein [Deltaproteobacteria bacterium]MCL5793163.1 2-oxoacid:acceptor oxidoreductase family protein [Deltaproteobacteria bacterium]